MSTAHRATTGELETRLAKCSKDLEDLVADRPAALFTFREYCLTRDVLESRRSAETPAAKHKPPLQAVKEVLIEKGTWTRRGDVLDELTRTGYITNRKRRDVISTAINNHLESGNLIRYNDAEGVETIIGLPGWEKKSQRGLQQNC